MSQLSRASRQRQRIAWLIFGAGLLILSTIAALGNPFALGDERRILWFFYNLPESWRWMMLILTQAGSAWMLFGLTLGLMTTHRYRLALRIVAAGSGAYIATEAMKYLVARPRPGLLMSDVLARESTIVGFGFPSGHTALATAMGLSLLPYLPKKLRWLPFVWIIVVAVTRLYLGVHAPLDIVGGFAVGLIAAKSQQLFTRLLPSRRAR